MVGDDGDPGANQVGVAPHAKWIAAKGCESRLDAALISSGQWILAPTELGGRQPAPGSAAGRRQQLVGRRLGGDPFYPADRAGLGRIRHLPGVLERQRRRVGCGTAGSPGDLPETYAAGAFDIGGNDRLVLVPRAVGLRTGSSSPTSRRRESTSARRRMGATRRTGPSAARRWPPPHVAGTVALIWSRSPELRGDIARTEQLLDQSATDVNNTTCGGDAADNNVWGEGKLNALAAVTAAPTGPTGTLSGTVRRADNMAGDRRGRGHVTGPGNRGVGTNLRPVFDAAAGRHLHR